MIVNFKDRVVRYRIAYAGAAFAGKSTSLACLAERYRPLAPAGVVAVKTDQDTRLDLVLSRSLSPNRLEVQVGTVPGSLYYAATIREVLRGTDGVVFVADSSARRCRNGNDNLEAWKRYTALLEEAGTPFVIQVNKRDVNDALPVEDVLAGWAPGAVPIHESCASSGRGVIEAFLTVLERAVARGAYPWSWPTPLLE